MRAPKSSCTHSLSLVRLITLLSPCIFHLGAATPVLPLVERQIANGTNAGLPTINSSDSLNQGPSQSSFSDGGGSGFSAPAVLWIAFAILLGLPLAIAGVRGWRLTSAAGGGLSIAFLSWTIFINTSNGSALSGNPTTGDLLLSLFVWGLFAVGAGFCSLRIGILVGVSLLGASAGAAIGILLALLRPGLLVPIYAINIIPIGLLAIGGAVWPIWHQRLAVTTASSACGSFLLALAIDLIMHKQSGMSLGIRFLLDRNKVHIAATIKAGYNPTLSTMVLCGVAIGIIPVLAFAQHRIWKQPFNRSPESLEAYKRKVNGSPVLGPGDEGYVKEDPDAEQGNESPKHIRLRFPSIIPSLPGNLDPQYAAQSQTLRDQRQRERANGANANPSNRNVPGPGVGRSSFMPYWASSAVRRMSTTFGFNPTTRNRLSNRLSNMFGRGGAGNYASSERRGSNYSIPSIYSNDVAAGTNFRAAGPSRFQPQQQPQLKQQQDDRYPEPYNNAQPSPIRPLQLVNQPGSPFSPSKAYGSPSKGRFNSSNAPAPVAAPPPARIPDPVPTPTSLRTNRSAWNPPSGTDNRARNDRNAGGVEARMRYNESSRQAQPQSQPRSQPSNTSRSANRLKPSSRYNYNQF